MLARRAGEAIAGDTVQEALQVLVAGGDPIEKPLPARTLGCDRRDGRHLRT